VPLGGYSTMADNVMVKYGDGFSPRGCLAFPTTGAADPTAAPEVDVRG